jgi:hypothetical protein
MSRDDELFDQIGQLLESRHGWIFEPSTTPGMPPSWCLDSGGEIELSVGVDRGIISIYLPNLDQEIAVDGVDELMTWIDKNEQRFLRP